MEATRDREVAYMLGINTASADTAANDDSAANADGEDQTADTAADDGAGTDRQRRRSRSCRRCAGKNE